VARDPLEDSSGSSESFAVVSENGNNGNEESLLASSLQSSGGFVSQNTTESMVEVSPADVASTLPVADSPLGPAGEQEAGEELEAEVHTKEVLDGKGDNASVVDAGGGAIKSAKSEGVDGEEDSGEEEDDNDSVVTVRPKEIERHATLIDLAASIKAFVGKLCGIAFILYFFLLVTHNLPDMELNQVLFSI
jgi:hypothetical protein